MTGTTRISGNSMQAAVAKKSKGSKKKSGGGNEWGNISKLFPLLKRGDANRSSQSGGLPYEAPQSSNPTGGGSPIMLIAVLAAVGIGAYLILHKKKRKQSW